jgi:hypothetical protein
MVFGGIAYFFAAAIAVANVVTVILTFTIASQ